MLFVAHAPVNNAFGVHVRDRLSNRTHDIARFALAVV